MRLIKRREIKQLLDPYLPDNLIKVELTHTSNTNTDMKLIFPNYILGNDFYIQITIVGYGNIKLIVDTAFNVSLTLDNVGNEGLLGYLTMGNVTNIDETNEILLHIPYNINRYYLNTYVKLGKSQKTRWEY